MQVATFSIVACDLGEKAWGVAVASRFLAVGAVVPWAAAGSGAVATQAYGNTSFGPQGLQLLRQGLPAGEALARLLEEDSGREQRQVGMVDALGRATTFTGRECFAWAGGKTGPGYACQGNILTGPEVIARMAATFEGTSGELAERLMAALSSGDRAGGDSRGRQSAALLVVKPKGGYAGFNDRYLDLRVDDARRPLARLRALLALHHLYFGKSAPEERIQIEGTVARALQRIMRGLGYYSGGLHGRYDEATRAGLRALTGKENLEDRVSLEEGTLDPPALAYLLKRFGRMARAAPPPRRLRAGGRSGKRA